ncbi:MAG: diguanylate cyclase [Rhodospirillales bacterium]
MPHPKSDIARTVTVSLGGTASTASLEVLPSAMMRHADLLLYRAKQEGRNRAIVEEFEVVPAAT